MRATVMSGLSLWVGLMLTAVAAAQDVPFVGVVVEKATLRSGAGTSYYAVTDVAAGTQVTVEEIVYGWNKVQSPAGTFSYISKAFVDAKGDGKTGVVNKDRSRVQAASVNGAADSYRRQTDLNTGATVEILGEEGSYYKIVPPKDAYLFLPPGAVRRLDVPEAARVVVAPEEPAVTTVVKPVEPAVAVETPVAPVEPAPAKPAPTVESVTELVVTEAPAPEPVVDPIVAETVVVVEPVPVVQPVDKTPREIKAASPAVIAAEEKFQAAQATPLEDQPIDELIGAFGALANDPSLPGQDQVLVRTRLYHLQKNKPLADTLREIKSVKVTPADELKPRTQRFGPAGASENYTAVGLLLASGIYNGESMPRLFRLVDPASLRTVAYVLPELPVNATLMLGKVVGVIGDSRFDPALKLRIITVKKADILNVTTPVAVENEASK